MIAQFIAAFLGTLAFAILYEVQTRIYFVCGLVGAIGWLVYLIAFNFFSIQESVAIFISAFIVVCISRFSGIIFRCPATMFLVPGIFPLVPGVKVYETFDAYMRNDASDINTFSRGTTLIAIAIVLAILLSFEIPQKTFDTLVKKIKKH
jgi:hypothetical protein